MHAKACSGIERENGFLPLLSYIQGCILKHLTPYLKQHCGNPISTLKNYLWDAFLGQINYQEAFCIIVLIINAL